MCGVIFKFVELSTRRKTQHTGGREDGYQLDDRCYDNSFHSLTDRLHSKNVNYFK